MNEVRDFTSNVKKYLSVVRRSNSENTAKTKLMRINTTTEEIVSILSGDGGGDLDVVSRSGADFDVVTRVGKARQASISPHKT